MVLIFFAVFNLAYAFSNDLFLVEEVRLTELGQHSLGRGMLVSLAGASEDRIVILSPRLGLLFEVDLDGNLKRVWSHPKGDAIRMLRVWALNDGRVIIQCEENGYNHLVVLSRGLEVELIRAPMGSNGTVYWTPAPDASWYWAAVAKRDGTHILTKEALFSMDGTLIKTMREYDLDLSVPEGDSTEQHIARLAKYFEELEKGYSVAAFCGASGCVYVGNSKSRVIEVLDRQGKKLREFEVVAEDREVEVGEYARFYAACEVDWLPHGSLVAASLTESAIRQAKCRFDHQIVALVGFGDEGVIVVRDVDWAGGTEIGDVFGRDGQRIGRMEIGNFGFWTLGNPRFVLVGSKAFTIESKNLGRINELVRYQVVRENK